MVIILFAQLAERWGLKKLSVPHMADTDKLIAHLTDLHPEFEKEVYIMAVDKNVIHENTVLSDNSVVALLPPYSGG